ncbi:MAG: sigma-70 family RNA polymerase sigma factor [Firmicutes bacterium]|nr:sigma-70 family RNA polymerase sigma factor [Bacillota bacterium]
MGFSEVDNDRIAASLQKYSDMVYRICFVYLGNRPDVDDVFQEVFFKLLQKQTSFTSEENEKAWLIRVTINQCKDVVKGFWWKRIDLMENVELSGHDPDERDVLMVVLSLPQKYKDVIYLYYYQEYTVPQMGQLLQRSENTIYSQLHRARELMRPKLEGKGHEGTF